ncbi:Lar family restriction alleviation protein [Salmonella enterica]|uniref:Restriction alleviation protein, Lar family n=1 Tax=Salmonella enterica subsp. enterica serovar Rough O:d:1,7 TaxID=1974323 RepID=A0A974QDX6_SALET|nr:Lar family restriction alleviation protein [Salmonella enterica]ECD7243444.1 restriction alleviation protein, Lar family [Salmonella enterica subsp. enterica serovar Florida]ECF4166527.1 restriction alleviation protein, Lar family [Salmonella enterica subsp. enterica serovar Florida]ECW2474272.1 restriction alleviation protein, Lar family [Salmonella enterica subsp. enterica serovar Florida]EIQ6926155.1 Lar family restriction alleviation protein [Salmonella enterica]EJS1431967.1 Lar family 
MTKKLPPVNPERISIINSDVPLKPCPFCGEPEVRLVRVADFCCQGDAFYVACPGCNANQFPDTKERAVQDWNQRREPKEV